MELKDYRAEIDRIDKEIVSLFQQRMRTCEGIARYKHANNLPVMDTGRELEKIDQVRGLVDKDMEINLLPYSEAVKKDKTCSVNLYI